MMRGYASGGHGLSEFSVVAAAASGGDGAGSCIDFLLGADDGFF